MSSREIASHPAGPALSGISKLAGDLLIDLASSLSVAHQIDWPSTMDLPEPAMKQESIQGQGQPTAFTIDVSRQPAIQGKKLL